MPAGKVVLNLTGNGVEITHQMKLETLENSVHPKTMAESQG